MAKKRIVGSRIGSWLLLLARALLALLAVLTMAACDEHGEGERLVTIELSGNPTTGYSWSYTMSPEGIIREVSHEYRQREDAEGIVGAGGSFLFVFEGVTPGQVELRFSYARPWEKTKPAVDTTVFTMEVDPDMNITISQEHQNTAGRID